MEASQRHLPSSTFGKAISYTLSQWELLTKYVANGRIEIDNNGVENAIRPTAIGKENWLFFGDAEAGQRSAVIYTIILNSAVEKTRMPTITPLPELVGRYFRVLVG